MRLCAMDQRRLPIIWEASPSEGKSWLRCVARVKCDSTVYQVKDFSQAIGVGDALANQVSLNSCKYFSDYSKVRKYRWNGQRNQLIRKSQRAHFSAWTLGTKFKLALVLMEGGTLSL